MITRRNLLAGASGLALEAGKMAPKLGMGAAWADEGSSSEGGATGISGPGMFWSGPNQRESLTPEHIDLVLPEIGSSWKEAFKASLPSPVSEEVSMFDRHAQILERWALGHSGIPDRLAEIAKSVAIAEKKAFVSDRKLGDWAFKTARGNYAAGVWKCNVFVAEMAVQAGIEPMYTRNGVYADTSTMLSQSRFACWRRVDSPAIGNLGVYPNHVFIVTNPSSGEGVSALSKYVQQLKHFSTDNDAHYRANIKLLDPSRQSEPPPEVIFFEYYCPDMRTGGKRSGDINNG